MPQQTVMMPLLGLDGRPPHLLRPGSLTVMKNARLQDGVVWRDGDYTSSSTLTNNVIHIDYFRRVHATPQLAMVFTTDKIRTYDGSSFSDITGAATVTCDTTNRVHSDALHTTTGTKFYFTEGNNNVRVWTGSGNIAAIGGSPQFSKARCLATFGDRIIVGNTTESGTDYPQRIRWSKVNDGENWTDSTSSFLDMVDSSEPILAFARLRNTLYVFTRTEIWAVNKVSNSLMFNYSQASRDFHLFLDASFRSAVGSLVVHNGLIWFFSNRGFVTFDGFNFDLVGEPITPFLQDVTLDARDVIGGVDKARDRVWFGVNSTIGSYAYNLRTRTWEQPTVDYLGMAKGGQSANDLFSASATALGFSSTFVRFVTAQPSSSNRAEITTAFIGDDGGRRMKRIVNVMPIIPERHASHTYDVTVNGYFSLDKSVTALDPDDTETVSAMPINTGETLQATMDVTGRWFEVTLKDTSATASAPKRMCAGFVIEWDYLGKN
jgi:hypothetical protein